MNRDNERDYLAWRVNNVIDNTYGFAAIIAFFFVWFWGTIISVTICTLSGMPSALAWLVGGVCWGVVQFTHVSRFLFGGQTKIDRWLSTPRPPKTGPRRRGGFY